MRIFSGAVGLLVVFCALAGGAHDYWAATIVYLAALGLWAALALHLCWPSRKPGVTALFLAPLGAAAAAFWLSFHHSVHPEESWFALMDWLAALLVFLSAQNIFRDERRLDELLASVAVLACVEEAVILRQHWLLAGAPEAPRGLKALALYAVSLQVPATMVNSSVATAFFLLWAPVLGARAWAGWREKRRVPRLWAAGFAASVLAVLSLKSHWGFVCLAAGLILAPGLEPWVAWVKRRPRAAAGAAAGLVFAFAGLIAWKFGHASNMNGQRLPTGETTQRLYWWRSGLRMFRGHPWFGIGLGNFGSAYLAYKEGSVQNTLYPHSWAVGLLAETGAVGAASAAAALLWALSRLAAGWDKAGKNRPYLAGLAAFALFGLIGLSLEYLVNLVCCGVFFGALAAALPARSWKPRRSALIVLAAACVFAVPSLLAPFLASRVCVEGQRLLAEGDAGTAAARFASAAGMDPRSSDAERGWARALYARYKTAGDVRDLEDAIVHQTNAARLNRLQGYLLRELDELRTAR